MRIIREFVTSTLVGGLLIVLPIYLTVLILLKGMQSVAALVRRRDRRRPRSSLHHRRGGERSFHRLRPVRPHASRRSGLHLES